MKVKYIVTSKAKINLQQGSTRVEPGQEIEITDLDWTNFSGRGIFELVKEPEPKKEIVKKKVVEDEPEKKQNVEKRGRK